MKALPLEKVSFISTPGPRFNGQSRDAVTDRMASDLRFENGFVCFSDKEGPQLVPLANVRQMTPKKAKDDDA